LTARLPDRQAVSLAAGFLASAVAACAWSGAAYELGVLQALFLIIGLVVVAVIGRWPLAGVCLALLAAPVDYLAAGGGGGSVSVTPSEALLFLTALSAAPRLFSTITLAQVPSAFYGFIGLVVISIVGIFVAVETFTVIRIVIDWIAFGIVGLYVSQLPFAAARSVALSLAISGGILGLTTLGNLSEQQVVAGGAIVSNRAAGSFAHPTSLALFLLLSFPLAFAFGLRGPPRLRAPLTIVGVISLIGLILTQTRGAMIGGTIALLWMMIRWQPFRRFAGTTAAILIIAAIFNVGSIASNQSVTVVGDRLSNLSLESEGDQRVEIWQTTPKIIANHPLLGIGQGNFPYVSPGYGLHDVGGIPFDHAHDVFFNIAVELGLPGLLVLLLIIASLFRTARRALRDRAGPVYPFALAAAASLLAILVNSITEYPLRQNLDLAAILVVIGLLISFERASRPSSR
jgi:hypothetical protein